MLPPRLRMLAVVDETSDAEQILNTLKGCRTPSFILIHEGTLADAILRIGISAAFDVVLLDLDLPDSRGLESLSRLQAAAPTLPIVILTSREERGLGEPALAAGAEDYLVKGDTSETMVLRSVRSAIIRNNAHRQGKISADDLAHSLVAENEQLEEERSLARTMQFDLLPPRKRLEGFVQTHGLAVDGFFEPSIEIGGDLWGCAESEDGRAVFYMFDFSGHGVGAALNVFRLHALLSELEGRIDDPAAALGRLNRTLCKLLPRGQYATIFLGIVDPAAGTLTWAAGGAPRPLLFDRDGGTQWLDTRGKPLGLAATAQYVNRVVPFPLHSSLFLYSDVMIESLNGDNEAVGEDGLLGMVQAFHSAPGLDIPGLVGRFTDTVGSPMDDDMTAVCITRLTEVRSPDATVETGVVAVAPFLLASRPAEALATGLAPPYNGFLQISAAGLGDVGKTSLEATEQDGLCISLTAGSAWSAGVASLLFAAISQRYPGDRDWPAIDIILGEVIGNAIVHGCLGIQSSLRDTKPGLDRYNEAVRQGLDDPARADKRIEVTVIPTADDQLEITVSDRGAGFDFDRQVENAVSPSAKHGRGLALIRKLARSVTSRDGGRTVIIKI